MKNFLTFTLLVLLAIPAIAQNRIVKNDILYQLFNSEGENPYAIVCGAELTTKTDLVIPATVSYEGVEYTVTQIAPNAFKKCDYLTSIVIPNSVIRIGSSSFFGCKYLYSATIGNLEAGTSNSGTYIGMSAFGDCYMLSSVYIGNSVTEIDCGAFNDCITLQKAEFASIESLCNIKFYEGGSSNPLYYTHKLYIGGNEITDLVIPNSVTKIGGYAFCYCSGLTSVEIPNSVTKIGEEAFFRCSGLTSVKIPNSVTEIGDWAFQECSGLTSIEIPNSVTKIGEYAFCYCSGLITMFIGNSVTEISEYAFCYCSGLTSVEIPNSVTKIDNGAFKGCSSLTSVEIPNSVTKIGEEAFENCSGLTLVEIPNSVTKIGMNAFGSCSAINVVNYKTTNPIRGYETIFSNEAYRFATLYVSEGGLEKAKNISPWMYFTNIQEKNFTGINEIIADSDSNLPVEFYDMHGVKVSGTNEDLTSGIYIVRQGLKSKKIIVK